jgi:aldehyde:ferredoxin oxidoreductase
MKGGLEMNDTAFWGKVLRINLTASSATEEILPPQMARDFIGGAGLGIKILFDEIKGGVDPLGPENKLVLAVGPFTGTEVPCTSRMAVVGKSPLTKTIAVSLTGGHFPVEMRKAGYIAVVIEGKSKEPVYVSIKDGAVRFHNGARVWGTMTSDCQQLIKEALSDQNFRIASIGPAGENLSRMACIINERRAAGRKGFGAVMGSKNLKAIAIRGTGTVAIASRPKLKAALKIMRKAMKDSPVLFPFFSKYGTSRGVNNHSGKGIFPAKNWTATGEFAPLEKVGFEARLSQKVGQTSCSGCPVGCGQLNLAKTGDYAGMLAEGPEYETVYAYGGQTGVDDLDSIIVADRLSDEFGLDTLSAGVTIGFAMELFERGILTVEDTNGMALTFGNHMAMVKLLRMMAYREGLGALLADGVKVAAETIGRGSEQYALHVKGLEVPAYDVRGAKGHGLNYATSFNGADHNRGYAIQEIFGVPVPFPADRFTIKDKGELTKWNQDVRAATCDSPTMCAFILDMALAPIALRNTADLMDAVTGVSYTPEEVMQVGERVNNLARAFNVREGFTRSHDTLPKRILTEPLKAGAAKGHFISQAELEIMLDEYYKARGWELETGVPSRKKLTELGLGYAAEQIWT